MRLVQEYKEIEKQAQCLGIYQKKIHQFEEEVFFFLLNL